MRRVETRSVFHCTREVVCARLASSATVGDASAAVAAARRRHGEICTVITQRPCGDPDLWWKAHKHTQPHTTIDICEQQSVYNRDKRRVFNYGSYNSPAQNLLGVHFFCPR